MTEEDVNKAIARIILSTKRKNRQYSLYEIALDIADLKKVKGGLNEVSKLVGISAGMLNRFLTVLKLPTPIIALIKKRKIDSVAMAVDLSKLNETDAIELAGFISSNKLSTQDIRTFIAYRKQYKEASVIDLIKEIQASKNIKVSVIRINKGDTVKSLSELDAFFNALVEKENVIAIAENNNFIDIKLSKNGEAILRQKAKVNNQTFQNFISSLIH